MADDAIAPQGADDAIHNIIPESDVAPQAPSFDATGLSRTEILAKIAEVPNVPTEGPDGEVAAEAAEAPPAPAKPTDNAIPGLEAEKPPEKAPEPPVDESEKNAADVADAPDAGKFRIKDASGKFAETPDVKVEFRVGDKVYQKDVASLVRMAYDGVAGQRAVAQARHLEAEVIPRLQQTAQQTQAQLQAELQAQIELNAAILSDPTGETWAANHEKFTAARSPEQIARRAQEEAASAKAQLAEQSQQQYIAQTNATYIAPVLEHVAKECPDVSDHTKAGFIADLTKDLLVNGKIPPDRFPELVNRISGPYVQMARAEQQRVNELKAATQKEVERVNAEHQAELRKAQAKLNSSVAPMKPVGAVAPSGDLPLPPPRNREEALERIRNGPLYAG